MAGAGKEVHIHAEPMSSDHVLAELTVVDATGKSVDLEYNDDYDSYWYFTMPATNVTVSAMFCSLHPKYLDGADENVLQRYDDWTSEYGYDCYGTNETAFLFDIAPTSVVANATPLKIVDVCATNVYVKDVYFLHSICLTLGCTGDYAPCRRIVLASDVTEFAGSRGSPSRFVMPGALRNGYLVLRIGSDLSVPKDEWLETGWLMDFADGRIALDIPEVAIERCRDMIEQKSGKPCNGLFLSPCISVKNPGVSFIAELLSGSVYGSPGPQTAQ